MGRGGVSHCEKEKRTCNTTSPSFTLLPCYISVHALISKKKKIRQEGRREVCGDSLLPHPTHVGMYLRILFHIYPYTHVNSFILSLIFVISMLA